MSFFGLKSFRQSPEMCQILLQPAENRTTFHTNALAHFTLTLPENDGKLRPIKWGFAQKETAVFMQKAQTVSPRQRENTKYGRETLDTHYWRSPLERSISICVN